MSVRGIDIERDFYYKGSKSAKAVLILLEFHELMPLKQICTSDNNMKPTTVQMNYFADP